MAGTSRAWPSFVLKFRVGTISNPSSAALLVEILAILAVGGVASGLRAWLFDSAATRVMARLRMRLFSSLMAQEMGAPPVP